MLMRGENAYVRRTLGFLAKLGLELKRTLGFRETKNATLEEEKHKKTETTTKSFVCVFEIKKKACGTLFHTKKNFG